MGAMFRSEEMALAQLFIQPEAAYQSISELGETGTVQFRDLNEEVNAFQRKFINEVRRCDEMERKLRYIEEELKKDDISIPDVLEIPKAPNPREIIDLEAHLEKVEGDVKEFTENAVNLKSNLLEVTEMQHVLEKAQLFLADKEEKGIDSSNPLIAEDVGLAARGHLGFVAGVINRERLAGFERMLWRVSRGNVFLKQVDIETPLEDPITGNEMLKTVFVAFFQGEQLNIRIKKICTGFRATLYQCPITEADRHNMLQIIRTRIEDLNLVLNQTRDHRQRVLVSVTKELQNWIIMVKKMKAIYHTLNMFNMDVTKKCLIGECWVPVQDIDIVQKALSVGSSAVGSSIRSFLNVIDTNENPPTFNRTNKFTRGFQNLIDSYGIASYGEINPALYTIVTFPFLFAVMFGDVGHAVILLLFAIFMIRSEKKFDPRKSGSEIANIFFAGRYIILLMGFFSLYTGFIYNDIFSKSMNIFGSGWKADYNESTVLSNEALTLNPTTIYTGEPYIFGMDPLWMQAENKILFLNTYKMKLSIVFGVFHMMFGVCIGVINYIHLHKVENIFLIFIPQIVFLMCLFLWMVIMIFMKWIMYSANEGELAFGSSCAPSVLITFINMMLFGSTEVEKGCSEYMFELQGTVQIVILVVAIICIPVMLLGKPIYIIRKRKSQKPQLAVNGDIHEDLETAKDMESKSASDDSHESEEMSDIFIYQAIHTIEYVLSTVSHTASYLRLWALSLAHAQLSEVLWSMVINKVLVMFPNYFGAIMLYVVFWFFAGCTIFILVMMEGLSAFLHTLRLHWVEFMSKFYEGLGYPFQPFCFKLILEEGEDD